MVHIIFFRLCGVPFEVQGPYLSLEVPGLAEKRPSLALGDTAIATLSNVSETQKFEGCIHEVRSRSILLMFDPKFHDLYCGEVYDVEFYFSRGQFRHGLLYILKKICYSL
jgi:helicase MOV-10